jgi:hypothetical protein
LKRSLLAGLLFCGVSLLLAAAGIGGLENTLVAGAVMVVFFLLRRPVFWPLAVRGGLLFLLVYVGIVKMQFYFWPGYLGQWTLTGVLGGTVFGVPLGEIVFAAVFALLWPLHIAFAFDVEITPKGVYKPLHKYLSRKHLPTGNTNPKEDSWKPPETFWK